MAASAAAYGAWLTGRFVDPVSVRLPKGQTPSFPLARSALDAEGAVAGVIKDAGDDPDVTHGALVLAHVRPTAAGSGVTFKRGEGVGVVTLAGLQLAVGEPAINPAPRKMIAQAIREVAEELGGTGDVEIEIAIPGGEKLAAKTMNGRLGIVGGLSVLGTTGIVIPYSCSSWIASIHRGIDVARAAGLTHVAGSTGSTSEAAVRAHYGLPEIALLDMGDFVGGLLKYLRKHPIPRLTIAGGFGKLTKLAAGHLDLHSGRSQVDFDWLAERLATLGADQELLARALAAKTANQVLELARQAGLPLADAIARRARDVAAEVVGGKAAIDVVVFDRQGQLIGRDDR
jgi:cobalt-precorrin-5B (C1)-methyltransferase